MLQQNLLRRAALYWKHMLAGPSLVVSKYILMLFCLGAVDIAIDIDCRGGQG